MIFDSLSQLSINFLQQEAILTITLTYGMFFILRLNANLFEKYFPEKYSLKLRITFQFAMAIIMSLLISSIVMLLYFRIFLGFTVFTRELIVFNSIFLISGVFYNLFCFGIYFLNKQNDAAIQEEKRLNDSIYEDFIQYQRDIRSEFFFSGLETLITQMRTSKNDAQKLIDKFSNVYRYFIDNRYTELIDLAAEMKHVKNVISVFSYKYNNNLTVEEKLDKQAMKKKLVPCTLHLLLEEAFFTSIINDYIPLNIYIYNNSKKLFVEYKALKKIISDNYSIDYKTLKKTFSYYSDEELDKECKDDTTVYSIPLIHTDE
jgi:hypothetical protein